MEIALRGDFNDITVEAPQTNVTLETGLVENFVVDEEATRARLIAKDGTVIESLNLYAEADITGGKNIRHAVIASGGVKMDQKPKQVTIAEGGQTIAYSNQGKPQDQSTPKPTSKPSSTPKPTGAPSSTPKPTSKPTAEPTQKPTNTPTPTQTPKPDTIAPDVPSKLTVTNVTSDAINLSWTASTDNVGVAGYRVYRKAVNEDGYTLIAEPNSAAFSDKNVTISCIYEYAVAAADTAGNESDKHFGVCIWCRPGAKTIWAASCNRHLPSRNSLKQPEGAGGSRAYSRSLSISTLA
jgi:cell division septation protein DedD